MLSDKNCLLYKFPKK